MRTNGKSASIIGLSFREHGAQVIRESLGRMLALVEAVRLGEDIEAVHDMRVASRRLRAALDVFGAAFPDPAFGKLTGEVKAVTDELGAARDLDVMIEALEKLDSELPEQERGGMDRFIEEKKADRLTQQKGVLRALQRTEKRDLLRTFEEIVLRGAPASLWNETLTAAGEGA